MERENALQQGTPSFQALATRTGWTRGWFLPAWWRRPEGLLHFLICLAALVLSVNAFARWLVDRPLDMDEIEFVRATRLVAQGKTPYAQFWEHHFPLQWYLLAPLGAVADLSGIAGFRVMRAGNAAFVAGSAVLAFCLASRTGRSRWPAAVAVLLLLSAQFFVPNVVTYRIDGPMCFFYLLGVLLLERHLEGGRWPHAILAAGAAMALCGLCSQRAVPGVAVAAAVYFVVRPGDRWGVNRKALLAVAAGVGVAFVAAAPWAFSGSLGEFWRQNVSVNWLYERYPAGQGMPDFWTGLGSFLRVSRSFQILVLLAIVGLALSLRVSRRPTFPVRMGLLAGAQLAFLSSISSPFSYQQQLFWWLVVPLSASAIHAVVALRAWPAWASPAAALALLLAGSGPLTWRMAVMPNFRAVQAHQDHVLRTLEQVTAPGEKVLDGCGWGVNREAAFRYWFLPRLVRVLTARGAIAPLTWENLVERPPAAIVMDSRMVLYLRQVGLESFVSTHFVPLERALWVPGMSGRLQAGEEKSWTVLVEASYRLVESKRHAGHPWFERAFDFPRNTVGPSDRFVVDLRGAQLAGPDRRVKWQVDGKEVAASERGGSALLKRGARIVATNAGSEPVAVFAVSDRWDQILAMPCFPSWFEPSEEM
jgi:hypothetical protein